MEDRMPLRGFSRRAAPLVICRAYRRNHPEPHQPGRRLSGYRFDRLAQGRTDLFRTLRGMHLWHRFRAGETSQASHDWMSSAMIAVTAGLSYAAIKRSVTRPRIA